MISQEPFFAAWLNPNVNVRHDTEELHCFSLNLSTTNKMCEKGGKRRQSVIVPFVVFAFALPCMMVKDRASEADQLLPKGNATSLKIARSLWRKWFRANASHRINVHQVTHVLVAVAPNPPTTKTFVKNSSVHSVSSKKCMSSGHIVPGLCDDFIRIDVQCEGELEGPGVVVGRHLALGG